MMADQAQQILKWQERQLLLVVFTALAQLTHPTRMAQIAVQAW